ncbi:NAD(P)/FAD-dependent oxidoreductase [Loktanella salsilacus]|uniref:NAD(P)/FAD-dependent oxidoreductase n=1 Tax=Loktanella salsilacus TaxID=195913 RepID=UPI003734C90E
MATADVTVMGAGVIGLSIAWACVQRGARVQVIDPGGVAAGASGGIVGALAPHVPEQWNDKKAFQLTSLLMAQAFWAEVAEVSGRTTGYARTGRLQPLADEAAIALAQSRAIGAAQLWQGQADWRIVPATRAAWEPPSPTGLLIHDTLTALIHPRQATLALAAAITAQGGAILRCGDPQGKVVWATGAAGLEQMTACHTRLVGAGVKGQAALLRHDASELPQLFVDTLHIVPHLDGTVAIGSTTERDFVDGTATDDQLDALIAKARAALPALQNAPVVARWAGVRPRSRSRAPMLGRHPFIAGAFIANGGFKIGFGMAPKMAQVMADLLIDDRDTIPADFDPAASL